MAQKAIPDVGAFTSADRGAITDNFTELFGTQVGGTLTDSHIMVGDGNDVATDVAVSGDASLANTGALTVTGVNGSAVTADGSEIDATVDLIAAIPTVDPEDGETIWNDNGVLKVAST